jgi:hypothetical protein
MTSFKDFAEKTSLTPKRLNEIETVTGTAPRAVGYLHLPHRSRRYGLTSLVPTLAQDRPSVSHAGPNMGCTASVLLADFKCI